MEIEHTASPTSPIILYKDAVFSLLFHASPDSSSKFFLILTKSGKQFIIISITMDNLKISNSELELAISFSDMMKLDLDEGASILASYDWDIERAIGSIDLNAQSVEHKRQPAPNQQGGKNRQKDKDSKLIKKHARQQESPLKQKQMSKSIIKEQAFLQSRDPFSLSEIQLSSKDRKQIPQIEAIATQFFISYITNKYHPLINFAFEGFFSTLSRSYKERKYVLVYVHYLDDKIEKQYEKVIKQIMTNKDISRFVNNYCITYGVIHQSPEYAPVAQYVSKQKNIPVFALFKYDNIREKQDFLSCYSLNNQDLNFLEWLSMVIDIIVSGEVLHRVAERLQNLKSNNEPQEQQDIIDDQLLEDQFIDDSQFFDMKYEDNPVAPHREAKFDEERLKIEKKQGDSESVIRRKEDNNLMEEQDAVYKKMERSYLAKRQVSELKHEQSRIIAKEREAKEKEWSIRRNKLQGDFVVPENEEGISVKFRLPDGVSVIHKFHSKDKTQKLFLYVDIFCRDHFGQKFNDFMLTLNFSDSQLENLRRQELERVFEGEKAVTVIVKQI